MREPDVTKPHPPWPVASKMWSFVEIAVVPYRWIVLSACGDRWSAVPGDTNRLLPFSQ